MRTLPKCKPEEQKINVAKELLDIGILMIKASAGVVIFGVLVCLLMISLDKLIP